MDGVIICGIDDSEAARGAVRVARALGDELGAGLVLAHVVEPRATDEEVGEVAERLERLRASTGNTAGLLVEIGHPADRLVAAARRVGASLIVVGSHGTRSSLLGSISADLTRRSPCPVVVVPPGADARLDLVGDDVVGLGAAAMAGSGRA